MNKDEFNKLQYQALRQEIDDTAERELRILVGGVTIIPIAQYISQRFSVEILMLAIPFLVAGNVILYIGQTNTILRCAKYIRDVIEREVGDPKFCGWENWIVTEGGRLPDICVFATFGGLSTIYYVLGVMSAWDLLLSRPEPVRIIFLVIYIGMGIGLIILSYVNVMKKYLEGKKTPQKPWCAQD